MVKKNKKNNKLNLTKGQFLLFIFLILVSYTFDFIYVDYEVSTVRPFYNKYECVGYNEYLDYDQVLCDEPLATEKVDELQRHLFIIEGIKWISIIILVVQFIYLLLSWAETMDDKSTKIDK